VRKWSGSNILAIISYNAGSGSASKWVKKLGDPRLGSTNSDLKKKILWIEQIPFRETRYYLQSVLASMTIYNAILNQNEKVEMVLD
jgi:soluble lytic murein transglycosylase